jgi:hypothetical protein
LSLFHCRCRLAKVRAHALEGDIVEEEVRGVEWLVHDDGRATQLFVADDFLLRSLMRIGTEPLESKLDAEGL